MAYLLVFYTFVINNKRSSSCMVLLDPSDRASDVDFPTFAMCGLCRSLRVTTDCNRPAFVFPGRYRFELSFLTNSFIDFSFELVTVDSFA